MLYRVMTICLLSILVACSPTTPPLSGSETRTPPAITQFPITETPTLGSNDIAVNSTIVNYRGNSQRTGVYDFPAIRELPEVQWRTTVSSTWLMPPLIADGILYTGGGGDGFLYALDLQTGEKLWATGGFDQMESTGAIAGDVIVAGGYSNLVQALDRLTGEVLWSFNAKYFIQASPLIVEEVVYIATDHACYALDLQTGQLIWETTTGEEGAFMGPPAYENSVIYATAGKHLLALDSESGKEIWHTESATPFLALAVADGFVYVGNMDRSFRAYDQNTGQEVWKFEAGGEFWSAPAVAGDILYAGNIDKYIYALNSRTGEMLWSFETGGDAVSEPILADGVVYVSDSSHLFPSGTRHLYALEASTGELLWTFETMSTFLPAPALEDDAIYITTGGEVLALK